MLKTIFFTFLICLNVSCKSDEENCPEIYEKHYSDLQAIYMPQYVYATESTNVACYEHGLEVIEKLNAYDPNQKDSCGRTTLIGYQRDYKMDTIPDKFIHDLENLKAAEVEELTNLICGRETGNELFKIQSLDSFEINDGVLEVEFTIDGEVRIRSISSYLDSGFNCPLYQFSCYSSAID